MVRAVRVTLRGELVSTSGVGVFVSHAGRRAVWTAAATVPEGGLLTLDTGDCWPDWETLQTVRRSLPRTATLVLEADPRWWAMWERVLDCPEPGRSAVMA